MTTKWDGLPPNPDQDGHYWLTDGSVKFIEQWFPRFWGGRYSPQDVVRYGWKMLGPALTPAEVEARVREAELRGFEECIAWIMREMPDWPGMPAFLRLELARRQAGASSTTSLKKSTYKIISTIKV